MVAAITLMTLRVMCAISLYARHPFIGDNLGGVCTLHARSQRVHRPAHVTIAAAFFLNFVSAREGSLAGIDAAILYIMF